MNKIINKKTPKHFYVGDRQLLRDTRLGSDAKNIYQVLSSLAESCENVCPGYIWLAQEVGYDVVDREKGKLKNERTIMKWVNDKIAELVELKMVVQLPKDRGFDYEVYDYIAENPTAQKSTVTLHKKVHSPLHKKVQLEERVEKKEFNTLSKNKENFDLFEKIEEIKGNPLIPTLFQPITELNIPEKEKEKLTERAYELCAVEMENKKANNQQLFGYMRNCVQQAIREFDTTKKTNTTIGKAEYYEGKKEQKVNYPQQKQNSMGGQSSYAPDPKLLEMF